MFAKVFSYALKTYARNGFSEFTHFQLIINFLTRISRMRIGFERSLKGQQLLTEILLSDTILQKCFKNVRMILQYFNLKMNDYYAQQYQFGEFSYECVKCCEPYPWRAPLHVGEYPPYARIQVSIQYPCAIILHRGACRLLFICLTCAHLCSNSYIYYSCVQCVFSTQLLNGMQPQRLGRLWIFQDRSMQQSMVSVMHYAYYFQPIICLTCAHCSIHWYSTYMCEVL